MSRLPRRLAVAMVVLLALAGRQAAAQVGAEVVYRVSIPEPAHHWMQVEVTFAEVPATFRARMSRASPGRYATHEFAKNVFAFDARDGSGRPLRALRVDADTWQMDGHDGTVRITYRIFGDHADGTYLAIDPTHAHVNAPAAFLWGVGLESRPARVTLTPPAGTTWTVATQLMPTADARTFTAPNLQYLLDSPIEMADLLVSTFSVPNADGRPSLFRLAAHAEASQADLDALALMVARLVREQMAVFGELPDFEPGHYTFLLDYMPWVDADAMEHRNSTSISYPGRSLATPAARRAALESISHELFHVWNVERIRPADLEPFDFTRANVSCCLWFAEGFTQYYGPLLLRRAGLSDALPIGSSIAVINGAGRAVRSAVGMSEYAPFADAAVANDPTDASRTFISYYTYGAAIALGLDLTLRDRTDGRVTLDDYMRRLWQRYGVPAARAPGLVARPYTLADLRRELGELVDDAAFGDEFFARFVEGREVVDYARLLARAGYRLERSAPGRGWIGDVPVQEAPGGGLLVGGASGALVRFESPAYAAGIDSGDVIVAIDDRPATRAAWDGLARRAPGDQVPLVVARRDGRRVATTLTIAADPALRLVPIDASGPLPDDVRAFRRAWLGSRVPEAGGRP